ncbi:MAG: serine/threonine protein kinase [Planctomycetes bacterium]|nr:serine/threonine protein kinase [Planctomycetota bacterium]
MLVRERWVGGLQLGQLLDELRGAVWACAGCGGQVPFDDLAALPRLACPRCGRELAKVEAAPASGLAWRPVPAALPEPPARLGSWHLLARLGGGSYGVVYLAQREGLERRFALKLLRPDAVDAQTLARFRLEAAAASKVQDPGVVAVVDVGQLGPFHYYAMEHCPGPTLKERLDRGPLPWRDAAALVAALARTLAATHTAGVLHRDLKPGNIILEEGTGRPRVTDFGLARAADLARSLTRTGEVVGTPLFMAPEQLRGERARDPRVDVYALGAILYMALTGRPPHDAASLAELTTKVLHEDPTPPEALAPDVPRALGAACLRALRRVPARRTPSAEALARDLEGVLAAPERSAGAPARRRAPLALLALALLAGAGVAAVALSGPPPSGAPSGVPEAAVEPPVEPPAEPPPAPAPTEAPPLAWGVAYYMPYDGPLSRQGPVIVRALAEGLRGDQVAVAVQADLEGPGGIRRHLLRAGAEPVERALDEEDSASLGTFRGFLEWVDEALPAPRLAIVLLGFGGRLDQTCHDAHPAPGRWLDVLDVAGAVADLRARLRARGRDVELLFLQQAARGQLENLQALGAAARVVMASQATLGAPNHYYGRALERLAAAPDADGRALARFIAEGDAADMFAAYSALDGAALEALPGRLEALLGPLAARPSVTLRRDQDLARWATFGAGRDEDAEVFVDGLALLRALARDDPALDPAAVEAFAAWVERELVLVRETSPLAGERFGAPLAGSWCGFSLLVPRSREQLRRYERRYPLLRGALGEVWRRELSD